MVSHGGHGGYGGWIDPLIRRVMPFFKKRKRDRSNLEGSYPFRADSRMGSPRALMEGWKKTYLRLFCSERCRGYASFKSFQPHRDHRALRASFSLMPLKWSKFDSSAVYPD